MENESKKPELQQSRADKKSEIIKGPDVKNKIYLSLEAAARLLYHIQTLEKQYPEAFQAINQNYPQLAEKIQKINELIDRMNKKYDAINAQSVAREIEEINKMIELYNNSAKGLNSILNRIKNEQEKEKEIGLVRVMNGEIELEEKNLTPAEKKELEDAAQKIYDMLFPESYTDRFVQWSTGQTGKLNDGDRIAAAPMNGIESAIRGVIGLLDPDTYMSAYEGIKSLINMSKKDFDAMTQTLKFSWEHTSNTNKTAQAISFITGCFMLFGSVAKVRQALNGLELSTKARSILGLTGELGKMTNKEIYIKTAKDMMTKGLGTKTSLMLVRYGPIGAMAGIALPYIHH